MQKFEPKKAPNSTLEELGQEKEWHKFSPKKSKKHYPTNTKPRK